MRIWSRRLPLAILGATLVVLGQGLLGAAPVHAEPVAPTDIKYRTEPLPKRLEGVDVVEHLETQVPPALAFTDEQGRPVLYDQIVKGSLPTILTLNYSDCPMLCSLQLNGLVGAMKQLDLTLGKDYRVVTVSIDPGETSESAHRTKTRYLAQYGRTSSGSASSGSANSGSANSGSANSGSAASDEPGSAALAGHDAGGWSFLHGSEANIRAVARALGFSYNYNEARDEYAHPAAFVVTTPDGVLSRYLYGLEIHPNTLRLSLIEASQGKIGSSFDRLILYCFHYDASEGRYAPAAMNIMRLLGGAFALALLALLVFLWRGERKKKLGALEPNHLAHRAS
jgi:protein SCO1/2